MRAAPVSASPEKNISRQRKRKDFVMHRTLKIALMSLALAAGAVTTASASPWTHQHPRRVEVNHRLAHENHRINRNLAEGHISWRQAAHMHREVHAIRTAERTDAAFDRSHLTRAEHRALNQNENGVSRQIYRTAH
jgi:hypothetical protein